MAVQLATASGKGSMILWPRLSRWRHTLHKINSYSYSRSRQVLPYETYRPSWISVTPTSRSERPRVHGSRYRGTAGVLCLTKFTFCRTFPRISRQSTLDPGSNKVVKITGFVHLLSMPSACFDQTSHRYIETAGIHFGFQSLRLGRLYPKMLLAGAPW